jgi:transcriptional regulator with XRE-family HTH domain
LGEMIRKRRLDLGLRQIDAAKMIGCDEMSVVNWEKGHRSPRVNQMAGVVNFLGFNPFQNGDTMAHRLVNHRKALGITQKEFAGQLGVDSRDAVERVWRVLPPGELFDTKVVQIRFCHRGLAARLSVFFRRLWPRSIVERLAH